MNSQFKEASLKNTARGTIITHENNEESDLLTYNILKLKLKIHI